MYIIIIKSKLFFQIYRGKLMWFPEIIKIKLGDAIDVKYIFAPRPLPPSHHDNLVLRGFDPVL